MEVGNNNERTQYVLHYTKFGSHMSSLSQKYCKFTITPNPYFFHAVVFRSLIDSNQAVPIETLPHTAFVISFFYFMHITIHKRPEGHFKVCAKNNSRVCCHLLLGLNRSTPFTVHTDVGLGIIDPKPGW